MSIECFRDGIVFWYVQLFHLSLGGFFLKKPLRSVEIAHYRCLEDTLICLHVLLKMIKQHGGNYVKFHKNVLLKTLL